ncbi:hypothetical protein FANTH_13931 [Fusarium anthophilum]|uniref:Aminoglycoside phosphotransferase domain-containing protein n=1 Tax=Fusarium anthophilum TaxID=48485 RepID=A0A8H5DNV0_9HYPO|nr:hypothetical protein FANTH_13931 [Fusarium anthophilum]
MIKPALDHMPAEILADICWHLCSHCTNDHLSRYPQPNSLASPDPGKLWEKSSEVTTGLLSLARTCQVLNNAATPYIYHNIDATGWPEEKITEFLRDRRQLQKRSFIRRLTYEVDPFPLYTLLCRMPGLQLLSLVDPPSVGQTLARKTVKKLHDLRYLHLESTHPAYVRDVSTLDLFETAPNIKTLIIKSGLLEWEDKLHDSPKVPFANITWLKLFNVDVFAKTLERILEKCGLLESFIYICQRDGLIELLPASIVNVRIDSKYLHKDMYQPMVALCQAKQAGSFPKLRSILQSNFDISQVPYTLGDLSELSERYGISFKQEASSVFPPPVARPQYALLTSCVTHSRSFDAKLYARIRASSRIPAKKPTYFRQPQHFIKAENLTDIKTAGEGLECLVYKASSQAYGPVVLRVPRVKVYQNANDPNTNASDLIQQEMKIYKLLENSSVPVPKAYKYLEEDGYPAMLCEYVDDDGTDITFEEMGRVAAMIHSTALSDPAMKTVALETEDVFSTVEQRLKRRFSVLSHTVPEASSWITDWGLIHNILEGLKRFPSSLLHMDFRDVNLRHKYGRISAVIDWTNALVGPAAVDIFRTLEFSELDESFVRGYTEVTTWPNVTAQEEYLLRLDAALVLALVFTSEAPDAERAEVAVARVKELSKSLVGATSHE